MGSATTAHVSGQPATGRESLGQAAEECKSAFSKGNKMRHPNAELARSLMPFVINFIYCFKMVSRKDGKFRRPEAVLRAARFPSAGGHGAAAKRRG